MRKNSRAISPVVATALLIVVAVVAVVSFQSWFGSFSSGIFTKTEVQSDTNVGNTQIDSVIGNSLYFKNSNTENITITSVKLNGVDCNYSGNASLGITEIDITNCALNLTTSMPEVVLYTENGIYAKKYFTNNVVSSNSTSNFIVATGGVITYSGNYKIHTFTSNGTFDVTYVPDGETVDYLVVGGGGEGGNGYAGIGGGGGGAGDFRNGTGFVITVQTYNITVGNGGNGSNFTTLVGYNGASSIFSSITSIGGGGGSGGYNFPGNRAGATGASAGGGNGGYNGIADAVATGVNGFGGGRAQAYPNFNGGAGGGAGSKPAQSTINGATGGNGLNSSITGTSLMYSAGGGAGATSYTQAGVSGAGISGVSGNGGNSGVVGQSAPANRGGGGGGGGGSGTGGDTLGGAGGSGVVVIKYLYQ